MLRHEDFAWDYISDGQTFRSVTTNQATDRIWGVLDKWNISLGGYQIAEYDQNLGRWIVDATQPEGVYKGFAVDSNGRPAFTNQGNNTYYK